MFFRAVFCAEQLECFCRMGFRIFVRFLTFDPNWPFCKGYSLCMGYSLAWLKPYFLNSWCLFQQFFAQNNFNVLVQRFSKSSHFFNSWCLFQRFFAQSNFNVFVESFFTCFLKFINFDLNWPFCKGYSLCMG